MTYKRKPNIHAVLGIFGFHRSLAVEMRTKTLDKMKIPNCIINADDIRDELYKKGEDFSMLYDLIVERTKSALAEGKDAILHFDNSGFKKYLWLKAKLGIFQSIIFLEVKQTTAQIYSSLRYELLTENIYVLPWYFEHHKGSEYKDKYEGIQRGIAVAKAEIARHLQNYKTGPDGNLVYKKFL